MFCRLRSRFFAVLGEATQPSWQGWVVSPSPLVVTKIKVAKKKKNEIFANLQISFSGLNSQCIFTCHIPNESLES